jgi:hypothetical protein
VRLAVLPIAAGMLALAAALPPPDPSPVFAEIDAAIASQDYYKANSLLGKLMNDLLAAGVPPLTGKAHREAMDAGRQNRDLTGFVQQARLEWNQAMRGEQSWQRVMVRLSVAFSSAVTLDSALPPALRYEQARARYAASPSIMLLHQLTLRAFEAGEYAATSKYLVQERAEIPRAYPPEAAGPILHRLETLAGILRMRAGDIAGAVAAFQESARVLKPFRGRRLREAPRMLLAQKLLLAGQSAPVLAFLDICAKIEYPGGEQYTDVGRNPSSPAQLKSAILAGTEPQFGPGTLVVY